MQLTQEKKKSISLSKIEELVAQENAFIKKLFSTMCMPSRSEQVLEENSSQFQGAQLSTINKNKPRAKSFTELQQRLEAIKSKSNLSYKDKILKKGIKNRLKKKTKINERKIKKNLVNVGKINMGQNKTEVNEKPSKPIFNSKGKMVFSKFDFSDIDKKERKHITDPKKLLENLVKQNEKIINLKESGEVEKAVEIQEKTAWKNALAKASGEKVRDDPLLLKNTIKKKEQQHKSSKKKWQARQDAVDKGKEERQKKRQDNIDKRKKTKKLTQLKRAAKRGKIISGF